MRRLLAVLTLSACAPSDDGTARPVVAPADVGAEEAAWAPTAAPTLEAVRVVVDGDMPTRTSALWCEVDGARTSKGGDADVRITWEIDGVVVAEGEVLEGGIAARGDAVVCVAAPVDGSAVGDAVASAPVHIRNAPPEVSTAVLEPEAPAPGDDVACAAAADDPDGDAVQVTYAFAVGGALVQLSTDEALLAPVWVAAGAVVTCTAIAFDGRASSSPVTVEAVVVD